MNEGVVLDNQISFRNITKAGNILQVLIYGHVKCDRSVVVAVEKWLDTRRNDAGHLEVKGRSYSYNAYSEKTDQPIVRYDCHGWGGVEQLHRHTHDPATGKELSNTPISLGELPGLDVVIRQAVERAP